LIGIPVKTLLVLDDDSAFERRYWIVETLLEEGRAPVGLKPEAKHVAYEPFEVRRLIVTGCPEDEDFAIGPIEDVLIHL